MRTLLATLSLGVIACGHEIGPIALADASRPTSRTSCEEAGLDGTCPEPFGAADGLMVDDFDQDRRAAVCTRSTPNRDEPLVNLLAGCAECFNDCNGAQGGQLDARIVTEAGLRGTGAALRFEFDVSQPASACNPPPIPASYAGFVELLVGNELCPVDRGPFNVESLNVSALSFWVLAGEDTSDWDLEVAIKDVHDRQSPKLRVQAGGYLAATAYAGGWQHARIPLGDFGGGDAPPRLQELRELNFTVIAGFSPADRGTLYLDEIAFAR